MSNKVQINCNPGNKEIVRKIKSREKMIKQNLEQLKITKEVRDYYIINILWLKQNGYNVPDNFTQGLSIIPKDIEMINKAIRMRNYEITFLSKKLII